MLEPWPTNQTRLARVSVCRAKGDVSAKNKRDRASGDFVLRYTRAKDRSEVTALLYGPLNQAAGRIEITANSKLWVDDQGAHPLETQPLLNAWFSDQWWRDLDFMLGIIGSSNETGVFKNGEGLPVQFLRNSRKFDCDYNSKSDHPSTCLVEDQGFHAEVNFTSVRCEENVR